MTTETYATTLLGAPALPRVNLMPPEIEVRRRFRRYQVTMGGGVGAAVLTVGLLTLATSLGVSDAEGELATERGDNARLTQEETSLRGVQDVYNQVSQRQQTLSSAMSREVRWSQYLNGLSLRIPDHVWVSQLSATANTGAPGSGSTGGTGPAAAPGGVLPSGIGQISFSGVAFEHNDVATWLESLTRQRGYADPYFTNSTKAVIGDRPVVNFTSTVTLSDAALSGRFNKPAGS